MNRIIKDIQMAIRDYSMIAQDEKIMVGLSGGADSVMLMHYLKFVLKLNVCACHINHKLRGAESERDMQFVKELCTKWEIELGVHSIDVTEFAQQNKLTVEQAGRQVRYECFTQTAKGFSAMKIATAHTLSDNVETIILNLTRGTGLKGLCGIPPVRDNIIRPLIYISRQDVETYCNENELEYVTDSSNLETVYTRNKIRHDVIPKLIEVNPRINWAVKRTAKLLINEQDFMQSFALEAYNEVKRPDGLLTDKLSDYHVAIRYRIISIFLDENKIDKSNDLIEKIDKLVLFSKGKINVNGNVFVEVRKRLLQVANDIPELEYFEYPVANGEFINDNGQRYTVKLCDKEELDSIKKVYKKLLYIAIDYDKIKGKAIIRQRKSGDKISIEGRAGTRSLRKMFIDDKLTAAQKSQLIVISDDESVIAVENYGADKRVSCDEDTTCALVIIREN